MTAYDRRYHHSNNAKYVCGTVMTQRPIILGKRSMHGILSHRFLNSFCIISQITPLSQVSKPTLNSRFTKSRRASRINLEANWQKLLCFGADFLASCYKYSAVEFLGHRCRIHRSSIRMVGAEYSRESTVVAVRVF